ncbi:MAG: Spy/CpxP family protein refolding chaperone [Myxococcota bacterium]
MFGFVIGTMCLFGLLGVIGGHHHHHHGHHRRWHGRGGWDRGGRGDWQERMGAAQSEVIKRRLHIDEDQEPMVDLALSDARRAVLELRSALRETRSDLARAVTGETVDDAAVAAIFAAQDEALKDTRRQILSAVKQIHAVLDPEQREAAAQWLQRARAGWV